MTYLTGTQSPIGALAIGDFNDDGKPDLVFTFSIHVGGSLSGLGSNLLPGNGDGTFGAPLSFATFGGPPNAVGDFNGDGKADLAVGSTPDAFGTFVANPFVLLGNGDGTAQSPASPLPGSFGSLGLTGSASILLVGDFNGDGKADLAVGGTATVNNGASTAATTWIMLGKGDGTFQPTVTYPLGSAVALGDFNGDGITDLVVTNSSGPTTLLLGNGDGTFPGRAGLRLDRLWRWRISMATAGPTSSLRIPFHWATGWRRSV